ncbi:tRNA (guanosine(46)-N7)-methyltransferase TrmB [Streptococcus chenjunshii]|uniref:tRNA (guanine-N(7)-)-methyltransferase n=1 Tax=Streptococcus chenjunshii TaxID=2173853 RepID=A0A372KLM1_9STRE|nr:tRNA (guanosine(46)-N7)-methyltransferase TrmB [Streptococcus chenjunshii]AXQ79459.1 tRNA (guanosine(46)-N7)-methyltransferase TrmB [Streptococcus chenjunshii]RFU51083.1 tRNA (guanosine(46)-N7)-methyltransferase TrmB [Streptococcus chenjunshii]RFU53181.1 tRNA (guanosine(46)-N7)-methyltransferase TrmB [Streptococcus chenjunshii]
MRVRKRKGAEEHLESHPQFVISQPEAMKGHWRELFGNDNPIHIEVGSGKGAFISGMALKHPDINYIAIDMQVSVLSHALDKVLASQAANVRLLLADGSDLRNYFAAQEVDLLYLNFSDPWPKTKHEKRRLTYKTFLETYRYILPQKGEIHFKTDNRSLFEYSLVSFSQYGMLLNKVWLDLHDSDFSDNVMTEYEEKFSKKGQVIYRVEAQFL